MHDRLHLEEKRMGRIIEIYIDQSCPGCEQAMRIANQIHLHVPDVEVRILDLARPDIMKPVTVFAVPTYLMDGKVLSLGNPDIDELLALIEDGYTDI
jgi:alkyl hydroperoxide reductase subunit AhpF